MAMKVEVAPRRPQRQCSECQLCCKLLPMHDSGIDKPAGKRCPHQKASVGCNIYPRRPACCQVWNCRWLVNDDTHDLRRPDRSHYVIDIMPDVVRLMPNAEQVAAGHKPQEVFVIQVWVDPKYPDAHRDPALRRYLERQAERHQLAGMIRFNEGEALILFAPPLTGGEWLERRIDAPTPGFRGLHQRLADRLDEQLDAALDKTVADLQRAKRKPE